MKRYSFAFDCACAGLFLIAGCSDEPAADGAGRTTGGAGLADAPDSGTSGGVTGDTGGATSGSGTGQSSGGSGGPGSGSTAEQFAELWYASGDILVHIALSEQNGSVVSVTSSEMPGLPRGQNMLTMLNDGSLVGGRLSKADGTTSLYHIQQPPRDGSPVEYDVLGVMPNKIMLEALYTDCEGRLYGMDTGVDDFGSEGNQLLGFTGDYLLADFSVVTISDLSSAVVADIDDMAPGIDSDGQVTDSQGLAIDTGNIYDFNYETGTGSRVARGGTWGIHVLGGPLFEDDVARVYLLSDNAQLFELDPETYALSEPLVTGPEIENDDNGWSGLAGPLTECESSFSPAPFL